MAAAGNVSTWRQNRAPNPRIQLALIIAVAAILYFFDLGGKSIGSSEAYSALAACQNKLGGVVENTLRYDPGKSPLYHLIVHYLARPLGCSEFSLRAISGLCGLVNVVLVYTIAAEMLGTESAPTAAAIWALNPVSVTLARWARMYAMLSTFSLAHLLMLWRLRDRASIGRVALCAIFGAAALYTHLGAALLLGAEGAILIRESYRNGRTGVCWLALVGACAIFAPFLPHASAQSNQLLFGHWLDWIGTPGRETKILGIGFAVMAGAAGLFLVFGPRWEPNLQPRRSASNPSSDEPLRWCLIWLLGPTAALAAGSMLIHPMFEARYLAASLPAGAILIGGLFAALSTKVRNLATAGISAAFVVAFCFYYRAGEEPWRQIAEAIGADRVEQTPVFFEAGFYLSNPAHDDPDVRGGFPEGFFRAPFDYYFHRSNQRIALDPFDGAGARSKVAELVRTSGGAWLVSGKPDEAARQEMPDGAEFKVELRVEGANARLYRISPATAP